MPFNHKNKNYSNKKLTTKLINMEKTLTKYIKESRHLVALTGAGISTESGISDYRGPNGVWTRREKGLDPLPRTPLDTIQPNNAHTALVKLFELGYLKFLISQNVDNLHLKSGFEYNSLVELHGNHNLVKCISCDKRFTLEEVHWNKDIFGSGFRKNNPHPNQPDCPTCHNRLISTIINFGDPMPEKELNLAKYHAKQSDVFLVLGSSLVVQPAASIPLESYNNGGSIIIVNKGETSLDNIASLKIEQSTGEVLQNVVQNLQSIKNS